jgi:hypothetical protein
VKKETRPKQPKSVRLTLSKRRLWLFRSFALSLPFLLLLVLELALRLADYGYPTTFFIRQRIGEQEFYVPNDRFGYRFFPPAIARTPFALRMPVKKPANTYRVFVFGESAAQGDPDPTFGVGRYLQTLLRQRYPGHDFEVVCVAMTAINSHAILPIARECAALDGDLWIVYMGNNEMVGPYGAATIFGPKAPPLMLVRASVGLKGTKVGQLIAQLIGRFRKDPTPQKAWGGLNMFKENLLRHNDPGRLRAYDNFAGNVESILCTGGKARVPILLSTVACNLSDCPPFASLIGQGWKRKNWRGINDSTLVWNHKKQAIGPSPAPPSPNPPKSTPTTPNFNSASQSAMPH